MVKRLAVPIHSFCTCTRFQLTDCCTVRSPQSQSGGYNNYNSKVRSRFGPENVYFISVLQVSLPVDFQYFATALYHIDHKAYEVGFVAWCFCWYPSCSGGSLFRTFMTKRQRIKIRRRMYMGEAENVRHESAGLENTAQTGHWQTNTNITTTAALR